MVVIMKKELGKNVTIKSIAEELGISFSTVSKALNNSYLVKEETRNLVLKKAEEMCYSPNMHARGLRNKTTKTIGVIFNDIENPVLTYIFKMLSIHMGQYGYTILICDSQFDVKLERTNILSVLSRMPDFVIISPTTASTDNLKLFSDMMDRVIVLGNRYSGIKSHYVHVDYSHGGYVSANELISKGHRNNLIITEPIEFPYSRDYVDGIKRAYAEYGLELDPDLIKYEHSSIANGYNVVSNLWDKTQGGFQKPFTGVMTFCDSLAHGVYKAVTQLGLKVNDDISVIGFDDNPLSVYSMPPLTTVYLPKEKIADCCIKIIHAALVDNATGISFYSLEPYLISRESVKSLLL